MRRLLLRRAFQSIFGLFALLMIFSSGLAAASGDAGAVFALSNTPNGNAVLIWNRAADGTLTAAGSIPTGGSGTGAGLGSQGALR